jgi:hypothetical protein
MVKLKHNSTRKTVHAIGVNQAHTREVMNTVAQHPRIKADTHPETHTHTRAPTTAQNQS